MSPFVSVLNSLFFLSLFGCTHTHAHAHIHIHIHTHIHIHAISSSTNRGELDRRQCLCPRGDCRPVALSPLPPFVFSSSFLAVADLNVNTPYASKLASSGRAAQRKGAGRPLLSTGRNAVPEDVTTPPAVLPPTFAGNRARLAQSRAISHGPTMLTQPDIRKTAIAPRNSPLSRWPLLRAAAPARTKDHSPPPAAVTPQN